MEERKGLEGGLISASDTSKCEKCVRVKVSRGLRFVKWT